MGAENRTAHGPYQQLESRSACLFAAVGRTVQKWRHVGKRAGVAEGREEQSVNVRPIFAAAVLAWPACFQAFAVDVSISVPKSLEPVIAESHEALRKILNGDPSGYAALFADRDDITLGNPFGPFAKGREAVLKALNNASTKYHDGSVVAVDRIAVYGNDAFVCIVEVEHDRAKLGTSVDFSEFAARVTSVYEKVGVRWKLVHRHADPITAARPAESVVGQAPENR